MFLAASDLGGAPAPQDDYWYSPIWPRASSGAMVSPASARQLAAVYACVKVISETSAMLPAILYRRVDERRKLRAPEHPLYRILRRRPNAWQTAMEWREMMQAHVLLRGNAFSRIVTGRAGAIESLMPLHPDRMKPLILGEGRYRWRYTDPDGGEQILLREEVFHLRGLSNDGILGLNPIEEQRDTIGLGIAARDYGARFFDNDATPPTWIEHPSYFKTDEDERKFKQSWQASQTGRNRGKTAVLKYGMKLHQLEIKNSDAQFIEARKFSDEEIARIFRVPPHKIQNLDKATFSNIEHLGIEFVTDCLMPWLVRWEQAIDRDLLPDENEDELFVEFLVDMLLRGDQKSRYDAYRGAIVAGWMTRNEARVKENMDPLDGLDEPLEPLNMAAAGSDQTGAPADQTDAQNQARAPQQDERIRTAEDRAALFARAAAERVIRKEVAAIGKLCSRDEPQPLADAIGTFYARHANYVAEVMLCSIDDAASWCNAQRDELLAATATAQPETGADIVTQTIAAWPGHKPALLAERAQPAA